MGRRDRGGAGLYQLFNGIQVPSLIKSIQRGTITLAAFTNTATIAPVNPANSSLKFSGERLSSGANHARIALADATTVTATRDDDDLGTTKVVGYEVVEYYPGIIKSIQRGTITVAAPATSNTATITAVNPAKTEVTFLGASGNATVNQPAANQASLTLTNSTTVTAERVTGIGDIVVSYEVIEWF